MLNKILPSLKALTFAAILLPVSAQSAVIVLTGTLSAANQNGSDPSLVTDPNGVVPTDATGRIILRLDDENMTLDIGLGVRGIQTSDLLDFGPNQSPIHLHNAAGGGATPGNFGPIAIDPTFEATPANFVDTEVGFNFGRRDVSILLEDQGDIALGMHPGNDFIVDALLSGNMFVAVHTSLPDGFPFVEIRGNFAPVSAVPVPAALPLLGSGLVALLAVARRRARG